MKWQSDKITPRIRPIRGDHSPLMKPFQRHPFSIENILTKGVNFAKFSEPKSANKSPRQISLHYPFMPLSPLHLLDRCDKKPKFGFSLPAAAFLTEFCSPFFGHNVKHEDQREVAQLSQEMVPLWERNAQSADSERRGGALVRSSSNRRVGHPYQRRTPAAQKKLRTSFSKAQIAILERRFSEQKYLASSERAPLAMQLRMQDAQVKTWFQNRRTKWRRQEAEERQFEHKLKKSMSENAKF